MLWFLYKNTIKKADTIVPRLSPKHHVLVVGGTQGIGAAVSLQFASLGASVHITGRSEEAGADMLNKLKFASNDEGKSVSPSTSGNPASFSFTRVDVTRVQDLKALVQSAPWGRMSSSSKPALNEESSKLAQHQHSLNWVILCAGGLNYGPRRETSDGIELTFAQNVLSRFILIQKLMPVVSSASTGDDSSFSAISPAFVNVLGAGNGVASLDMTDPQLKKSGSFSFIKAAVSHATMTDLYMRQFSEQPITAAAHLPRFYSFNPVAAATRSPSNQGFPWYITAPASLVMPWIAYRPDQVADTIVSLCLESTESFGLVKTGGTHITPSASFNAMCQDGTANNVWSYLKDLTDKLWNGADNRLRT